MPTIRYALIAALALAPAAAVAQDVIVEPPMAGEMAVIPGEPMMIPPGPVDEQGAATIAMMNGMASVEDVDRRFWDGNFEVEGTGGTGEHLEIVVDAGTGAVLDIDD
jgi:hypothetical protein